jgi:UDP-N-acetyl-2-amino-2-deoxyglucuronate dehydrogenase
MKKGTLRFGIIGCGRIAQRHAEHIEHIGTLVAACDIVK